MKFINWLKGMKRDNLIKNSFLLPILLVVAMSISHVVSWYDLGNPFAWAVYLSVAIEIFALASVSAASININRASVWFLFALVTSIQIIGNIFFEFNDIDQNGKLFQSWVSLVQPFFEDWTPLDHRRLLAIIQGGSIPMMSLIALNYYIKFGDKLREKESKVRGFMNVPEEVAPVEVAPVPVQEIPKKEEPTKINKKDDDDDIAVYAIHHE
jgi:hypothetical protein